MFQCVGAGISCLSSSNLPTSIPKSHVPQSMSIPVRASSSQPTYPTHILAIGASKSSGNEDVFMFPVHSIVIAAQCSGVPRLSPSSSPSSGVLHVPVLPLASPAAIKVPHGYLHNHCLDGVLKSLFPIPGRVIDLGVRLLALPAILVPVLVCWSKPPSGDNPRSPC